MKRYALLLIIALTLLAFTACSENGATPTESEPAKSTTETASALPNESPTSSGTEESEPPVSEPTEQPDIVVSSTPAQTPQNTPPTSKPSTPPAVSQPPATTPKPPEQPKPTDPPATSTPTPAFDPQPYVDYAISYGKSIGLIYEPAIGDGNWNSPLNLYAALTDESMKSGIRGTCDRVKREGAEYFWVKAVKSGDQSYQLFVYFG